MRVGYVRNNERGASIAIVAVSLFALMGMAALAIDVGMLLKTRSDAQRVADAASLAGASEFLRGKPLDMVGSAADNALEYSARNYVGQAQVNIHDSVVTDSGTRRIVNSPEAYIQVIPDEQKVRVWIRREQTATWFGNLLGLDFVPIAAKSAAQAVNAGTGKCVKPFAMADIWDDADDDNDINNELEDIGPGQGKNSGERWDWQQSDGDRYRRFQDDRPGLTGSETGYGSPHRNTSVAKGDKNNTKFWDDYGRPIVLKKSNPQQTAAPGFFQPWVIPGSAPGAKDYKANLSGCNPAPVNVNVEYTLDADADTNSYDNKPGNMIGPTKQGMDSLINLDPKACWVEIADTLPGHYGWTSGEVRKLDNSNKCTVPYPDWESSPRVAIVPLFDPDQLGTGRTKLKFNNLALIFIEDQKARHEPVVARFLYFAKSTGPTAPFTGSLIKKLQLIE